MDKEFDMSQEMIEASDLFDMNLEDPQESTLEDQGWEYVDSKDVYDEDGFRDVYYWYKKDGNNRFFFSSVVDYGDPDYFDWETDGEESAQEWFDSYGEEDFSEFDDEFTYESFNPDLSKAERKYFIHKLTDELQKEPYYYSKEEANEIAIKRADNLGPDWRVRWDGDLDAQIRQEVRSTATKAEWEDDELTEAKMHCNLTPEKRTAVDGKTWWVPYDEDEKKYSTLTVLGKYKTKKDCQDAIDRYKAKYCNKESLTEDLQTDIVSKSEAKKAYDNGETVYISYAGGEYYGYSNSMGTSFEDLLDSRYGNSKNLSFMVDHRPLTKDHLIGRIKDRKDSNNETITEAKRTKFPRGFKLGSDVHQNVKVRNPYNYTIQELSINNKAKTFERGNFSMGRADIELKNKQEYEDIVDLLKDEGYTEIPSDYHSLRNKTRKGALKEASNHKYYIVKYEDDYGWDPAEGGTTYFAGHTMKKKMGPYSKEDAVKKLKAMKDEADNDPDISTYMETETELFVRDDYTEEAFTYIIERDDRWGSKQTAGGGWDWSPEKSPVRHPKRGTPTTVREVIKKYPKSRYMHIYFDSNNFKLGKNHIPDLNRIVDHIDVDDDNMIVKIYETDDLEESLRESADNPKVVIYKVNNIYHTTDEDNYNARIQNARKIYAIDWAESAQDIIDYYIRYGWADSKDDFIVIDESLTENTENDDYDDFELAGIYGGEMIYCPICGEKLEYDDGYSFCPSCKKSSWALAQERRDRDKRKSEDFSVATEIRGKALDECDISVNKGKKKLTLDESSNKKIRIYINGEYVFTTTQYPTVKAAVEKIKSDGKISYMGLKPDYSTGMITKEISPDDKIIGRIVND